LWLLKMGFKHLKYKCAGCERVDTEMNMEHVFPKWLILRTNTHKTKIRWIGENKINALSATLPLCIECNRDFGNELEIPVSKIFSDLEQNKGISDNEAELLIRWLWKLDGMFWIALNPKGDYSPVYTLRQKVLQPSELLLLIRRAMARLNGIIEPLMRNAYKKVHWLILRMLESRLLLILLPTIRKDFTVHCFI